MEIAKVTSKGQITIPKAVRDDLGLETGDKVIWIRNGSRWEVTSPERVSAITAEERAASDRLKARFLAEAVAEYDLDMTQIKNLSRDYSASELLDKIRESMAGIAEEKGWETEEDIADYVFKERYESRK